MELWGHGQSHRRHRPGVNAQKNEAVQDKQQRRNDSADKECEQRRSETWTSQPLKSNLNGQHGFWQRLVISFSMSINTLEPHDVSEWPRHSHPHRRGNGRSKLLQGLPVEARVGLVVKCVHILVILFSQTKACQLDGTGSWCETVNQRMN